MDRLQERFDGGGMEFVLEPGEYEGPLRVTRPCVIEGNGATLWAARGPVLVIESPGVRVKNLRVEITGEHRGGAEAVALLTKTPDTALEQVEVRGDVEGLSALGEAPHWDLPPLLSLGDFSAGEENSFSIRLTAPAPAELLCALDGGTLRPARLTAGEQTVCLQMEPLRDRTVLYGELFVKTRVLRRICVTGRAMKDAPRRRERASIPVSGPEGPAPVPPEWIAPAEEEDGVPYMRRGQRAGLQRPGLVKAVLEYRGLHRPMDLDCYVFLLQDGGKVRGDADFVFFGNPESPDRAVRLVKGAAFPVALADLERLDPGVERLAVCYSIYEDGKGEGRNFSQVQDPMLRMFLGEEEICRLKLEDLQVERTLVAVEIYRYKGQWKMNFVGAGYRDGLRRLCESYGVEVE